MLLVHQLSCFCVSVDWSSSDNFKAVVWLVFLIVAYPLIVAFVISLSRGTALFTDKSLIALYRTDSRKFPSLAAWLVTQSKIRLLNQRYPKIRTARKMG